MIAAKTGDHTSERIVSGVLHVVFGLILLWYSLAAAILFCLTDRLLRRSNKPYTWTQAVHSLAIPLAVWLLCMGIVWLEHVLNAG